MKRYGIYYGPGEGRCSFTRFPTFLGNNYTLTNIEYWYALREVYIDSDNLFSYRVQVKKAFLSKRPGKEYLMTEDEQKLYDDLPEMVRIFRGMTVEESLNKDFGVSWSLKKEVAEYFSTTYPRNHATNHLKKAVVDLIIPKDNIIALFNGREELEVIYIWNFHR